MTPQERAVLDACIEWLNAKSPTPAPDYDWDSEYIQKIYQRTEELLDAST